MSTAYEETGRSRQKARTRAAMLDATRELLAEGENPTVEQVADRAGVSRSTAYRYFPNRHALLVATYPELDAGGLLGSGGPSDPRERFDAVLDELLRFVVEREPELRANLRMSLDPATPPEATPLRRGRAIRWYAEALEPALPQLGEAGLRRLVLAVRAAAGIESYVWLRDVARLSPEEAVGIMRSTARTLLDAALRDRP